MKDGDVVKVKPEFENQMHINKQYFIQSIDEAKKTATIIWVNKFNSDARPWVCPLFHLMLIKEAPCAVVSLPDNWSIDDINKFKKDWERFLTHARLKSGEKFVMSSDSELKDLKNHKDFTCGLYAMDFNPMKFPERVTEKEVFQIGFKRKDNYYPTHEMMIEWRRKTIAGLEEDLKTAGSQSEESRINTSIKTLKEEILEMLKKG